MLAFFASADGVVNDNLAENFCDEVQIREVKMFYDFQRMMENVHNEVYGLLIETLVSDERERRTLQTASVNMPVVQRKVEWAQRWMDASKASFAERLIAFAVVEGVFFSGSFAAIFYFKSRNLLPGVCTSNTLIARDEGMHQQFATFLYRDMIEEKLPVTTVHRIVDEAVDIERQFIHDALSVDLIGLSKEDMTEYIQFVADRLLTEVGVEKLYHSRMALEYMSVQ